MKTFDQQFEARIGAQLTHQYMGENEYLTQDRSCKFTIAVPTGYPEKWEPRGIFCDHAFPGQFSS